MANLQPVGKYFFVLLGLGIVVISLFGLLCAPSVPFTPTQSPARESVVKAIELMKDWAIWMASIQTASLAAMAVLAKDRSLSTGEKRWVAATTILSGWALLLTAWVLAVLPSVLLSLPTDCKDMTCNFYNFPIYKSVICFHIHFRALTFLQHLFWFLGLLGFAVFASLIAWASPQPRATDLGREQSVPKAT